MTQPPDGRRPRPTRHRGPIMLRGGEPDPTIQGTTTDQRLLDRRGPTDWVHTDPWGSVTATPIARAADWPGAGAKVPESRGAVTGALCEGCTPPDTGNPQPSRARPRPAIAPLTSGFDR
jgi:hypothetical protein